MRKVYLLAIFFICLLPTLGKKDDKNKNRKNHRGSKHNEIRARWEKHKTKHSRVYNSPEEEELRQNAFITTHEEVLSKHNESGGHTFEVDHNKFSDKTWEEKTAHLGIIIPEGTKAIIEKQSKMSNRMIDIRNLPQSLDYRNDPCLQPIKNQGHCGSCYSFAATAPLEFSSCKKKGQGSVSLSEQQIVDCDSSAYGCNGGFYTNTWKHIKTIGGVKKGSSYPYTAHWSGKGTCKLSGTPKEVAATVSSYAFVTPSKNSHAIMASLKEHGPIATIMQIVHSLYHYSNGIYNDPACDNPPPPLHNHAVVIVGYGREKNMDYWIVRNSWGTTWGLAGYFFIQRGVNKCNIEAYPAYVKAG